MELEIAAMQDVARTLKKLPEEMRNRVAHWVACQPWGDEPASQPAEKAAE